MGFWFSVLGLFKKYWKFFAIAALLIGIYFAHQHAVNKFGNERFEAGISATLGKMKTEIAKKNRENRVLEDRLNSNLIEYAKFKERVDNKRDEKESALASRAMSNINKIPFIDSDQCDITSDVLNDRNAIRRLGPTLQGENQ